jgi:hypothetical protein
MRPFRFAVQTSHAPDITTWRQRASDAESDEADPWLHVRDATAIRPYEGQAPARRSTTGAKAAIESLNTTQ